MNNKPIFCGECAAWSGDLKSGVDYGECWRYPPQVISGISIQTRRPRTRKTDACFDGIPKPIQPKEIIKPVKPRGRPPKKKNDG